MRAESCFVSPSSADRGGSRVLLPNRTPSSRRRLAHQGRGGRVVRADTLPGKPVTIVDLHRLAVTDADLAPVAEIDLALT
ncbi:MAG: hypothetical protein U0792_17010 [Gemmataceae bacterium]